MAYNVKVSFAANANLSRFVACAHMCCSRKVHRGAADIGEGKTQAMKKVVTRSYQYCGLQR